MLPACLLSLLLTAPAPAPAPVPALELSSLPAAADLANLLWTRSPELVEARGRIRADRADVVRSQLLPNPGADLAVGTLPLGQRNPPSIGFFDVPNVSLTVSELFEIGKRGPRQRAAAATLVASASDARELLRQRWLDLDERIADVAASELRLGHLRELAADAAQLADSEEKRAQKGDTPGLDADRARLEAEKLVSNLAAEEANLGSTLVDCARAAGVTCHPFGDAARALAFLEKRLLAPAPGAPVDVTERPDVQSLSARESSALAQLDLAHARSIPDPSLRAGFTHDQFVVSGAQSNSLLVGVSVNLPAFDRGQADAALASSQADAASMSRALVLDLAQKDQERLGGLVRAFATRREALGSRTLPLARGIVDRLEAAVKAGGAVLQDLLLARRTLGELLLSAADLDATAYKNRVALARVVGELPPLPAELAP